MKPIIPAIKAAALCLTICVSTVAQSEDFSVNLGINTGLFNYAGVNLDLSQNQLLWHNYVGGSYFVEIGWVEFGSYVAYQHHFGAGTLAFGPGVTFLNHSGDGNGTIAMGTTNFNNDYKFYGLGGVVKYSHAIWEKEAFEVSWSTTASAQYQNNFAEYNELPFWGKWTLGLQARF